MFVSRLSEIQIMIIDIILRCSIDKIRYVPTEVNIFAYPGGASVLIEFIQIEPYDLDASFLASRAKTM